MEGNYILKVISYYSGTDSIMIHACNPGIHMCTKISQDLKNSKENKDTSTVKSNSKALRTDNKI